MSGDDGGGRTFVGETCGVCGERYRPYAEAYFTLHARQNLRCIATRARLVP